MEMTTLQFEICISDRKPENEKKINTVFQLTLNQS